MYLYVLAEPGTIRSYKKIVNKSTKNLIKRKIAWLLIVLMSINSFAATVSDNDGSAFITQAEFDSLKNQFMTTIKMYNEGLDGKIGDAVNAYVANAKQSNREKRLKLVSGTNWTMFSSADYPTYTEGKPYIHGNSIKGHACMLNVENSSHTQDWLAVVLNGNEKYKTNGGFKKNYVEKVGRGTSNSFAGERYYAKYLGYYENEGENITLGGWNGNINLSDWLWINPISWSIQFACADKFSNLALPAQICSMYEVRGINPGCYARLQLMAQAASRIVGDKKSGDNVSIWNDIDDSRWYDSDMKSYVGITKTTPSIPDIGKNDTFTNWWADVVATTSLTYVGFRLEWNNSGGYWYNHTNGGDGVVSIDIGNYVFSNSTYGDSGLSYLKMANEPNGLQWKYLWSPQTDGVAFTLVNDLRDTKIKDTIKSSYRNVLIYDANEAPHLSLNAGFPFLTVKKGEKVEWKFNISDTTHAIVVGKHGAFSATGDPLSECDVEFTNGRAGNKKYFDAYSSSENTMRFEAEEDSVIFLKWITDSTLKKATITLDEDPTVELN